MKILRKLRDKADELGLIYEGLENGSKHYRMLFKNKEGVTHGVTLHKTKNEVHKVIEQKMFKRLEDFASNNYHNVKVR